MPDCVPVMPDFSNMIPAKLTGKPFWDLYLYRDPPIWDAYVACARHYGIDSLMDGYFPLRFPEELAADPPWRQFIVFRSDQRIVTQASYVEAGKRTWRPTVDVYYVADPPTQRKSGRASMAMIRRKRRSAASTRSAAHRSCLSGLS